LAAVAAADQSAKSLLTFLFFVSVGILLGFFLDLFSVFFWLVRFVERARASFRFHYPKRVQIHFKFRRRRRHRVFEASSAVQLLAFGIGQRVKSNIRRPKRLKA